MRTFSTHDHTIAINILSTGVVHGGLRLVSEDTGIEYKLVVHGGLRLVSEDTRNIEYKLDELCDGAALLDGNPIRYKVVLKKLFNDALQADDVQIVMILQDQYKADLITHV